MAILHDIIICFTPCTKYVTRTEIVPLLVSCIIHGMSCIIFDVILQKFSDAHAALIAALSRCKQNLFGEVNKFVPMRGTQLASHCGKQKYLNSLQILRGKKEPLLLEKVYENMHCVMLKQIILKSAQK